MQTLASKSLNLTKKQKEIKVQVIKYKPNHTEITMSLEEFCDKYKDNLLNAISNFIVENEEQFSITSRDEDPYLAGFKYFCKNFIKNFNEYAYRGYIEQSNEEYKETGANGYTLVNTYDIRTYKYEIKKLEFVHILPV